MSKLMVCASALLLLLLLSQSSPSHARTPCCTRYTEKPVPRHLLKAYIVQTDTDFCNIRAVIFKTVKNKFICADPEKRWVKRAMKTVPCQTF